MTIQHYPIEIQPPDITSYRDGNTGVDYVHVLDSGRPGPTAMVQALTHGNEICGAIALDFLFRSGLRPERRLVEIVEGVAILQPAAIC